MICLQVQSTYYFLRLELCNKTFEQLYLEKYLQKKNNSFYKTNRFFALLRT